MTPAFLSRNFFYISGASSRLAGWVTTKLGSICGPVGQFAIRSARMMGVGRVIAIDEVPERLAMAEVGGAETSPSPWLRVERSD
jgi:hypothetical protein